MGRRGPAPKPTKLKLLMGERNSRINPAEPISRDTTPEPPEGISPEVRDIWDYTLAELQYMKVVTAPDRDALMAYCEAVVLHRKASAILAKSPILVKGVMDKTLVRNPAIAIQRDAAHAIRVFAQEFGLTPSARTRIRMEGGQTGKADEANPFTAVS